MIETNSSEEALSAPMLYYVNSTGVFLGGFDGDPPDGGVSVSPPPTYADQIWSFETETWGVSRVALSTVEDAWREEQVLVIMRQLEALEEAEADVPPDDLLPGTRTQWLSYRGKVRAWKEGNVDFPDIAKRPTQPS